MSVDPTGKRCRVSCPCRAVHIFSTEALLNGTATCIAVKPTAEQLNVRRNEKTQRQRWRERDWRPGR